jgi:hypothetical protein
VIGNDTTIPIFPVPDLTRQRRRPTTHGELPLLSSPFGWLVGGSVLVVLGTYAVRMDRVFGLYVDDAWYLLLARALADGQGFTLTNSTLPGTLPLYPPGHPWLMSLVLRLPLTFATALVVLKSVAIGAMLVAGMLTVVHFRRDRAVPSVVALGIAVATVASPAFVFFAASTLMSEPTFTALQLAWIVVLEPATREHGEPRAALAGLVAGAAVLVRTVGAAPVGAAGLYLICRRRWRETVAFVGCTALVVVPWAIHAALHAPTPEQQAAVNDSVAYGYATQFWLRLAGNPQFGTISLAELSTRVGRLASYFVRVEAGALVAYPWIRMVEANSFYGEGPWRPVLGTAVSVLAVLGLIRTLRRQVTVAEPAVVGTVLMAFMWPFDPFRFILPLLPFLLYYVGKGVGTISSLGGWWHGRRVGEVAFATFIWAVAAINVAGSLVELPGTRPPGTERAQWQTAFDQRETLLAWVRENLPRDAVIMSNNPALVHLLTGRKSIGGWNPKTTRERLRAAGAHYRVDCGVMPSWPLGLSNQRIVYRVPGTELTVLEFNP